MQQNTVILNLNRLRCQHIEDYLLYDVCFEVANLLGDSPPCGHTFLLNWADRCRLWRYCE
jgi:hypothetical protein